MMPRGLFLSAILGSVLIFSGIGQGQSRTTVSGETVYVPAYSSVFHGELKSEMSIAVTLSIHNTDMKNRIIIEVINYYNTSGRIIRNYIDKKRIILNPLQTYNLGVREKDTSGGVGANFIVKWNAAVKTNRPVIETVMIGTKGQQGISFTSRGVVISE